MAECRRRSLCRSYDVNLGLIEPQNGSDEDVSEYVRPFFGANGVEEPHHHHSPFEIGGNGDVRWMAV